ncbi:hypothetical protein LCGC14_2872070, partial [marine sediment metagenome]
VLVYAYDKPAIPVDIHVHRISNRLGLVNTKTPEDTELELMNAFIKAIKNADGVFTVAIQPNAGWNADDLYALTKPMEKAPTLLARMISIWLRQQL